MSTDDSDKPAPASERPQLARVLPMRRKARSTKSQAAWTKLTAQLSGISTVATFDDLFGGEAALRATAHGNATPLLILDEPTRGIDVGAKAEIEKLMHSLRDEGMAILFISSELEEVVRDSQRVIVLRDRIKAGELAGDEINQETIMRTIAGHERGG